MFESFTNLKIEVNNYNNSKVHCFKWMLSEHALHCTC